MQFMKVNIIKVQYHKTSLKKVFKKKTARTLSYKARVVRKTRAQ